LLHLAGILSSRFAHDARSQEHKVEQVFIVKYFVFCAYVFFFGWIAVVRMFNAFLSFSTHYFPKSTMLVISKVINLRK